MLAVMAEMIANRDRTKKQDGELTTAKRWLNNHGEEYAWLQPTLLGAHGYSHEPFCGRYWKRDTIVSVPVKTKRTTALPRR